MKIVTKILLALIHLPVDIWLMFITYLPGQIGFALRQLYWKRQLKFMGKKVLIDVGIYLQKPEYISLDDGCWIDRNVIILAGPPVEGRITHEKANPDFPLKIGDVYIGKNVHIAPNCILSGIGGLYIGLNTTVAAGSSLYSFSHHYRNLNDPEDHYQYSFGSKARFDQQSMILGPIYIGDYCGVGLHSVILPGTSLKRGSWVASGSIVSGSYTEQSMIRNNQELVISSLDHLIIKE